MRFLLGFLLGRMTAGPRTRGFTVFLLFCALGYIAISLVATEFRYVSSTTIVATFIALWLGRQLTRGD